MMGQAVDVLDQPPRVEALDSLDDPPMQLPAPLASESFGSGNGGMAPDDRVAECGERPRHIVQAPLEGPALDRYRPLPPAAVVAAAIPDDLDLGLAPEPVAHVLVKPLLGARDDEQDPG